MPTVLGLDLGTSKLCALALSVEPTGPARIRTLAVRTAPSDADVRGLPAERHEQDPDRILEVCLELVRAVLADDAVDPGDVAGVCVSGQMHGVLVAEPDAARGFRPATGLITWRDQRALEPGLPGDLDGARSALGGSPPARLGCGLHAGYGGVTLHWLSENGALPEPAAGGAVALSIAGYVTAALTGTAAAEPTHAASWGIFDLREDRWAAHVLERLGIPSAILPPINPCAVPVGELLPERAGSLGLPGGVRACSPVGDNQASVVGAAGFAEDVCVVNLGTGGQVSIRSPDLRVVRGLETRPMPFGGWILVGASLCGGWSYAYLRRFYQDVAREMTGSEVTDAEAYERLNELAGGAPAGASGLRTDTRFGGARGEPEVRGAVTGIDTANLTPANLARAVVEGMVGELAGLAAGIRPGRIVATGNAARRIPLVREAIERTFSAPCAVRPGREEAALGAALCAAVGLGLVSTDEVTAAVGGEDAW